MPDLPDAELSRPASQPVHGVAALFDVRIPVSDGIELSANLWLPEPLPDRPGPQAFPAVLEMLPYRKDDWHAASDAGFGEWLAARGYALLPPRRPRHGLVPRHRPGRVHGARHA